MVKSISSINFHSSNTDVETVPIEIFYDDSIRDLKYKVSNVISKMIDKPLHPIHQFIWFTVESDMDKTIKILDNFYYSTIKYETVNWITTDIFENGLKRLGLGSIDEYPKPAEMGRYKFNYFQRPDVRDIINKYITFQSIGNYIDSKNNTYNLPSKNPFDVNISDIIDLPESASYNDMSGLTIGYFGKILQINVVDSRILSENTDIVRRYCPKFNIVPESNLFEMYEKSVFPILDFVSGYRNMDIDGYIINKTFNKINICFNDSILFPKHLNLSALFNNLESTVKMPYIEMVDPVSYEKIYKLRLNEATSTPVIDKDILQNWIDGDIGKNTLLIKILFLESDINNYGNLFIYNNGKIDFDVELNEEQYIQYDKLLDKSSENPIYSIIKLLDEQIVNFINTDYQKYVINSIKIDKKTKQTFNNLPKKISHIIPKKNEFDFNKVISNATSKIDVKLDYQLDLSESPNIEYFPSFIDCLFPFVYVENKKLTLNQKVNFKIRNIDPLDISGKIHKILLNGKYIVVSEITKINEVEKFNNLVGDNKLEFLEKSTKNVFALLDLDKKNITLGMLNGSEIIPGSEIKISESSLKNYMLYFRGIPVYYIENKDSTEYNKRIQLRWKRVNEFKKLSNLGKEILEWMSKGYLKPETDGTPTDKYIRRSLQVKHGGIYATELDNYIKSIRNKTFNTETAGNSGIPIEIDIIPKIELVDNVRTYTYTIHIDGISNFDEYENICNFIDRLFFSYKQFFVNYSVERGKKREMITGKSEEFSKFLTENKFRMEFDNDKRNFECNKFTKKKLKEVSSDTSDTSDSDEEVLESDDEDDDVWDDLGINLDDESDDEYAEPDTEGNEIIENIVFSHPELHADYSNPDDYMKNADEDIISFEKAEIYKRDARTSNDVILSKLYIRDPDLFKWKQSGYKSFSRVCQGEKQPVILTDLEKTDLDQRIKDTEHGTRYSPEGSNSCEVDMVSKLNELKKNESIIGDQLKKAVRDNDQDAIKKAKTDLKMLLRDIKIEQNKMDKIFEKCGSIKYGSTDTKQNWYICPKIWCPSCKLSLDKSDLKGDKNDRCPICSRIVIDRSSFYGEKMFGWPGFLKSSQHPNNLWLPCCYQSKDINIAKTQVRDSIFNAYGIETSTFDNNGYVIKINSKRLDTGRYGTLPKCFMNFLTKDNSDYNKSILNDIASKKPIIITNENNNTINNFYRRGLGNEPQDKDFLSLIASLYSKYSNKTVKRSDLIKLIIENLTLDEFLTLNRGILDVLFRDIDNNISSFQNFLEYLQSDESINFNYLWELCTKKNKWLFEEGINLVLIECIGDELNVLCPPFPDNYNKKSDLAVAIKYNTNNDNNLIHTFEQVVHNVFMSGKVEYEVFFSFGDTKYDTIQKLKNNTFKCGISPNLGLLSKIMEKNRMAITPLQFPLLNLVDTLESLTDTYKVINYITNNYNKIIGLLVNNIVNNINTFIPVYPSGRYNIDNSQILNIDNNGDLFFNQLDTFYNTYQQLKTLFILQLKRGKEIVKQINSLPMEIILNKNKNKIVAIITISNSIVPIRETSIEKDKITDGFFYWEDDSQTYRIKVSERQYYRNLDKYIRQKPLGIIKYSQETSVKYMIEELDMGISNINLIENNGSNFLFINFDDSEIALPFSYNDENKEYVSTEEINKIKFENLPKKDLISVVKYCNSVWENANKKSKTASFRPIRYKMDTGVKKIVYCLILESGLEIPTLETNILDSNLSMIDNTITDKYEQSKIDYFLDSELRDPRIKLTAKLDYEEEIFNIIKYEFSLYLQSKSGQKDRKKIIDILDNVFDLLHTRKAREEIFKILNKFIVNYGSIIYGRDMGIIESRLENYHVPSFRENLTKSSIDECDNPHYLWRENENKPIKKGCKIIIPKTNLIHKDLENNKNNKLYRIVDEIIRDKNIRLEIIDGLFPKSIDDRKYTRLNKNEIILTGSELVDDRYTTLYKLNISPNLRRDEYNNVIDTFDFTQPDVIDIDIDDKANAAMKYLDNVSITLKITRTGDTGYLFE